VLGWATVGIILVKNVWARRWLARKLWAAAAE